jgi:teichuronic acid biosynthesis glycosyltransferase TuaC
VGMTGSATCADAPGALRVLVFTTVFPSDARPLHGVFVLERIRHLTPAAQIVVVAPVPWHMRTTRLRRARRVGRLAVIHPRFFYVPRIFKVLDGLFLFLSSFAAVRRVKRRFDFDLIDAHFAFPDGFAAALLSWWFKRPLSITVRGTLIPLSVFRLRSRAADWALRRASRVIAVAQPLAARVRQAAVPPNRVVVIPNGVDLEHFALVDPAAARQRLGVPNGRLVVSVGHLSRRKGFHHLVRSMALVRERHPDARCAIIGGAGAEGDQREELERLIAACGLQDVVDLRGPRPHAEIASWLGAADVVVLASDYEGCPNVVDEALACGRPVVATRVGDVERMVPPRAGVLIDLPVTAERLADAISDALGRRWIASEIRASVSDRTWHAVAARVLVQWESATGRRRPTAEAAPVFADPTKAYR